MSYLLETLGRGLLGQLVDSFEKHLPREPEESLHGLERAARSGSATEALRFGAACLRELRLASARAAFESALQDDSHRLPAILGLACVHDELGRSEEARMLLDDARAVAPDDPVIAFAQGMCAERRARSDEARAHYHAAVRLCPRLRNAHERLAAIAVHRQAWDDAIHSYHQLAELDAGDLDVRLTLAALDLQRSRSDQAVERFQNALLIEPEAGAEALGEAEDLGDDARLAAAIASVEKLVDKYPGVTEFRVHLADLHVKAGNDDLAIENYRAALDLHPGFLEATVKLGTQQLRLGHVADAALAFNRAVELNDRLLTAFVGLGVAQHGAGRGIDASATFDLATGLAPNSALLLAETARLQLRTETTDDPDQPRPRSRRRSSDEETEPLLLEAIRRHAQALSECPGRADLRYRHGMLLRQVGDLEGAVRELRQAVDINPTYCKALIKLGVSLREQGRPAEAIDAFQKALWLDEKDIDTHYQLALLFSQRAQFDLAVERFESQLRDPREFDALQHNLALSLENVGMVDRAAATWRGFCELQPAGGLFPSDRFRDQLGG